MSYLLPGVGIYEKVSENVQHEKLEKKEKRKTERTEQTQTNVKKPMTREKTWASIVKEGLSRESRKVTNGNDGKNKMRGGH